MGLGWDDCGGAIWAPTVACDRVELVGERQQLVATDIRIWRKAPVGLRALFFSLQTSLLNCTPSFKAGGCGSLRLLAFPLLLCKRVCPYVLSAPRIYVPSTVGGLQHLYLYLSLICYYCEVITINYYKELPMVRPSYIKKLLLCTQVS
jgi:hypothetical protein